jgi:hypothetical protein
VRARPGAFAARRRGTGWLPGSTVTVTTCTASPFDVPTRRVSYPGDLAFVGGDNFSCVHIADPHPGGHQFRGTQATRGIAFREPRPCGRRTAAERYRRRRSVIFHVVGSIITPEFACGVAASQGYAYVAFCADDTTHSGGLEVISVANPAAPYVAGLVSIRGAYGVEVSGNHALVAALESGLQVVNIGDPRHAYLEGGVATSDWARDVAVNGDWAYVACYFSGMAMIDVSQPGSPVVAGTPTRRTAPRVWPSPGTTRTSPTTSMVSSSWTSRRRARR